MRRNEMLDVAAGVVVVGDAWTHGLLVAFLSLFVRVTLPASILLVCVQFGGQFIK